MFEVLAEQRYVRLRFHDGDVVVTPADYDVFTISAEQAIEACRDVVVREERIKRVKETLFVPLHDWCRQRADRVRACYVPLSTRHISVFVVTRSERFDFKLAEEIAALELSLSKRGWRIGVTQLPETAEDSTSTFFDPKGAIEINADVEPAQK